MDELERERELLGKLLEGESALELLMGEMTADQFRLPEHGMIWSAMVCLRRRGARVDVESVIAELGESVVRVGGPETVRAIGRTGRPQTATRNTPLPHEADGPASAKPTAPSSREAEQAVLGALLLDRTCAETVMLEVGTHDFELPRHTVVFDAIQRLICRATPPDPILVSAELDRVGQLENVGGCEAIKALAAGVRSSANAVYHARLVRDASHLRAARRALEAGLRAIDAGSATACEILARTEHDLFLAHQQVERRDVATIGSALSQTFAQILRSPRTETSIKWGYPSLDELTLGLHRGDLVVVASRPGLGKSTFATNVLRNVAVARPGESPRPGAAYFSLEMPKHQLVVSLLCSMAKVDSHRVRAGCLSKKEEESLLDWGEVLERAPIYVDDTPGLTIPDLRSKARRLKLEGRIDCVFVDYLQLIRSNNENEHRPRHEVVAEISRSLKALARDLAVPVVALAQLNRDVEDRPDHRPRLRDLRESGSIEVDADVVLFVHRDEYYMTREHAESEGKVNKAQLILPKNRNGPTGEVELYFAREFAYFGELSR